MSDPYGPRMRSLINQYVAREAIPTGGVVADFYKFLYDKDHRHKVIDDALKKVLELLDTVRPFYPGETDEQLADRVMIQIENKKSSGHKRKP